MLERIVDQKKKKEQRGELLQMLESVKADDDELRQMTSLSAIQTKGIRREPYDPCKYTSATTCTLFSL